MPRPLRRAHEHLGLATCFVEREDRVVHVLARSLAHAVLLDDESLTPITYGRHLGELDDVRTYSVLQRGTPPAIKAELLAMGMRTATEAFSTSA